MERSVTFSPDACVFRIEEPLYIQDNRRRLHGRLSSVTHEIAPCVIVDFSKAEWFGTLILDEPIETKKRLSAGGGDLRIVPTSAKTDRILEAACGDRLKLYSSVQRALVQGRSVHAAA